MRCAPNQVGTLGVSTLNEIWHQKDTLLITEKCQKSSQAMRQKTAPSSVPHPLPECPLPVVEIPAGSRMYVLEDGEGERGYSEVRGG